MSTSIMKYNVGGALSQIWAPLDKNHISTTKEELISHKDRYSRYKVIR